MSDEKRYTLDQMRAAYGHRAEWLYFLCESGLAAEEEGGPLHAAIRACGHVHGARKFAGTAESLNAFAEVFRGSPAREVFDMQTNVLTDEVFEVEFHVCPLVRAWKNLGATDEQVAKLCDIAMEGDRGIIEQLGNYRFELPETIANGSHRCLIRVTRNEQGE